MDILGKVKGWARSIIDIGVVAIALSVVLQVLFGGTVPFLGVDVVGNITGLVSSLGSQGLVGLVALAVLYWCFNKD
jgi:hypothetical protein|tara:strand:- start:447 stop:674 length:228 start_codon:yes stop_codon:yes gene_type:complete